MTDQPKSQSERFKEAADKAEADQSDDALDKAFGRLQLARSGVQHASDCALHNAPAYPAGACDCQGS